MVLDFILSPAEARKDPWSVAFAAAIFVSFGFLVELFLPIKGSIIIFAMVPAIPLIWTLLLKEIQDEEAEIEGWTLGRGRPHFFARHFDLVEVFAFFFLGAAIAYTIWFAMIPAQTFQFMGVSLPGSHALFDQQLKEVSLIRGEAALTGQVAGGINEKQIWFLFSHNLQVLALMFAFCLIYGIGSIYLLLWNASIIGVVLGQKVATIGILGAVTGFFSLLPHGIFELSAYFVASIGGAILSIELMQKGLKSNIARHVFEDVAVMTVLSIVLLAVAAVIEGA